jgi:hypothetical protein
MIEEQSAKINKEYNLSRNRKSKFELVTNLMFLQRLILKNKVHKSSRIQRALENAKTALSEALEDIPPKSAYSRSNIILKKIIAEIENRRGLPTVAEKRYICRLLGLAPNDDESMKKGRQFLEAPTEVIIPQKTIKDYFDSLEYNIARRDPFLCNFDQSLEIWLDRVIINRYMTNLGDKNGSSDDKLPDGQDWEQKWFDLKNRSEHLMVFPLGGIEEIVGGMLDRIESRSSGRASNDEFRLLVKSLIIAEVQDSPSLLQRCKAIIKTTEQPLV